MPYIYLPPPPPTRCTSIIECVHCPSSMQSYAAPTKWPEDTFAVRYRDIRAVAQTPHRKRGHRVFSPASTIGRVDVNGYTVETVAISSDD